MLLMDGLSIGESDGYSWRNMNTHGYAKDEIYLPGFALWEWCGCL